MHHRDPGASGVRVRRHRPAGAGDPKDLPVGKVASLRVVVRRPAVGLLAQRAHAVADGDVQEAVLGELQVPGDVVALQGDDVVDQYLLAAGRDRVVVAEDEPAHPVGRVRAVPSAGAAHLVGVVQVEEVVGAKSGSTATPTRPRSRSSQTSREMSRAVVRVPSSRWTITRPCWLVTTIRPSGVQVSAVGAGTLVTTESVKPGGSCGEARPASRLAVAPPVAGTTAAALAVATRATRRTRTDLKTTPQHGQAPRLSVVAGRDGTIGPARRPRK